VTVVPNPSVAPDENIRVIPGGRLRRPSLAPWMVVVIIGMVAFLGLGFARTSLDRSAFDLAELNREIAVAEAKNLELRLQVARLESPARIAPLADQLGMVIPAQVRQLMVDLDAPPPATVRANTEDDGTK
jgi:cell division protein FtsL